MSDPNNFGLGWLLEQLREPLVDAVAEVQNDLLDQLTTSRLFPATVIATDATGKPTVLPDSQSSFVFSSSGVPMPSLIGAQPVGARVMVFFDPPSGFYVVGSATNQPPWNSEWGKIATVGPQSADFTPITTIQDLTAFTATWFGVPGRRYRTTAVSAAGSSVSTDILYGYITDGSNNKIRRYFAAPGQGTFQMMILANWHEDYGSGITLTRKLRFERNSGTGTVTVFGETSQPGAGTRLLVEDIGPA